MVVVPVVGGTVVYSPTWLGDDTFDRVEALGKPLLLFAPNHYHNLSLGRFHARYPDVPVAAGARALDRLKRKTKLDIQPIASLAPTIQGARFLECDGAKSGDTWVLDDDGALVVGDAFFNAPGPMRGFEGWAVRMIKAAPGLSVGVTFTQLVLDNTAKFLAWTHSTLETAPVKRVLFCHGDPLEGESPASRLRARATERIG